MTTSQVVLAADKAHTLDKVTQDIIQRQDKKDRIFRRWCYTTFIILLALAILGIFEQNHVAQQNKQHIDCIVKLFTSPNRANKIITNPEGDCNIELTK